VTAALGQPEKGSRRAYVFRIASDSCRKLAVPALTFSATTGHQLCQSRLYKVAATVRYHSPFF